MLLNPFFGTFKTTEYDIWLLMCNLYVTWHKLVAVLLNIY